jgi:hypothetical protein
MLSINLSFRPVDPTNGVHSLESSQNLDGRAGTHQILVCVLCVLIILGIWSLPVRLESARCRSPLGWPSPVRYG